LKKCYSGGVHSARSLMWSVEFGEIERLQHRGPWDDLAEQIKDLRSLH